MPYGKETLLILAAYAVGCFTTGYYLVRWWTGTDVRASGSGSVGATNVGRVMGRPGFFLTVLGDFSKGVFAVWLAEYFQLRPVAAVLAMLAAVIGHIWPAQLRFHGGKGVATGLGALLICNHLMAFTFVPVLLVLWTGIRNFVLAGMAAFTILPLVAFGLDLPLDTVFGLSALAVLILIAHRKNIPDEIAKLIAERKLKGEKRAVPK